MEETPAMDVRQFLEDGRQAEKDAGLESAAEVVVEDGWLEDAGNFFMYPFRILMGGTDKNRDATAPKTGKETNFPKMEKFFRFGAAEKGPGANSDPTEGNDENTPPSSPAKRNDDGQNTRLFDSMPKHNGTVGNVHNRERTMSQIVLTTQKSKASTRILALPLGDPKADAIKQELESRTNPGALAHWNQFLRSYQHFYGLMRQSMANLIQESYPDDLPLFVFWAEVRRSYQLHPLLRGLSHTLYDLPLPLSLVCRAMVSNPSRSFLFTPTKCLRFQGKRACSAPPLAESLDYFSERYFDEDSETNVFSCAPFQPALKAAEEQNEEGIVQVTLLLLSQLAEIANNYLALTIFPGIFVSQKFTLLDKLSFPRNYLAFLDQFALVLTSCAFLS